MNWQDIAIIGMQVRLPEAQDPWQYWANIQSGRVSLSRFGEVEGFVGVKGVIENADCFDAEFFQISQKDAMIMDPQHRIFIECVWQALEISGYQPNKIVEPTGVFASCSANIEHWKSLGAHPSSGNESVRYQNLLGNDKDFLATRTSYQLNLKGPSYTVQSGCSSSAVSVHQACRFLQLGECDLAVAGGVSLTIPLMRGYKKMEGMIYSQTGFCRPFSKYADGTIEGTGAGVIILKRLEDAMRDKDHIWGVIKGSAVNNDGRSKVNFTAPSVDQQVAVMQSALNEAGMLPHSIEYIEAHGTGTVLGDAIELTALQEVYGQIGDSSPCYVGSVKANIGHLDAASGIAGLLKTTLCLEYGILPPQPGVHPVNDLLEATPSRLCFIEQSREWKKESRRAAVSSLGVGGTNVHMILENFPKQEGKIDQKEHPFKIFNKTSFPSPAEKSPTNLSKPPMTNIDPAQHCEAAWKQVLGTTSPPTDNEHFFDLGGNSLSSIEFIEELNSRLNLTLPSVALYEFPTYKRLLEHVLDKINGKEHHQAQKEEEVDDYFTEL